MDRERFWALMEATRMVAAGGCEAQGEQLFAILQELSPDEIVAFDRISDELLDEADRRDLQGACHLIHDVCTIDSWLYFRGWLLAQGRATWEAVLADPDALAEHPMVAEGEPGDVELECEDILYAPYRAYEARTGEQSWPERGRDEQDHEGPPPPSGPSPAGEGWDFDDPTEQRRRYPRLWARFGLDDEA